MMNSRENFDEIVKAAIDSFAKNRLFQKINEGKLTKTDYHNYLKMIFYQTYNGASSFALAGAMCDSKNFIVRDYLIQHADEEKAHWQWVLEDLSSSGYVGPDPRSEDAPTACQAYVGYNFYIALKFPIARLGIAAVLEGIGAKFANEYGRKAVEIVGLKISQLKFVFGHGDTDVGHSADIIKILGDAKLSEPEWRAVKNAARTASQLYRNMFDEVCK